VFEDSAARHWVLGIDSSSEIVSIALVPTAPAGISGAELTWPAGRNQTTTLLAQIDHLLRLCDVESDNIGAVAVATGPGGFSALRVGMSVAKGFAWSLDIPIFGVGTLDLAVAPVTHWGLPVRGFVSAGRGRVVFADYTCASGRLHPQGEMTHRAPANLAADLLQPTLLIGDLSVEDAGTLGADPNVILPSPALRRRRAAVLVDLIVPRWQAGDADDLVDLEPLYVHQPPQEAAATSTGSRA
jgi:tRNA threonylcarbamoyladenosine biosynthesis protein TsaB